MSRYLKGRGYALQIVASQFLLALVLGITGLAFNFQVAISLLLGGMICVSANLWLALVAFRPALGEAPQKILAAFYVGEFGKFIITALLFLLAFSSVGFLKTPSNAALTILAYVITQAMTWVYPLLRK
jgi:ATP synthase protein I